PKENGLLVRSKPLRERVVPAQFSDSASCLGPKTAAIHGRRPSGFRMSWLLEGRAKAERAPCGARSRYSGKEARSGRFGLDHHLHRRLDVRVQVHQHFVFADVAE